MNQSTLRSQKFTKVLNIKKLYAYQNTLPLHTPIEASILVGISPIHIHYSEIHSLLQETNARRLS
jgi:hypothetical protein